MASTFGSTVPTVDTRRSRSSSRRVTNDTGDVSVMPYPMQISLACISLTTRFITSTGHGAPAIIPVRSEVRSNSANRGCSSIAIHIVGTP